MSETEDSGEYGNRIKRELLDLEEGDTVQLDIDWSEPSVGKPDEDIDGRVTDVDDEEPDATDIPIPGKRHITIEGGGARIKLLAIYEGRHVHDVSIEYDSDGWQYDAGAKIGGRTVKA